ncbi:MAG: hypothetical protein ACK4KT_05510 [Thermaurantimonas sp.]
MNKMERYRILSFILFFFAVALVTSGEDKTVKTSANSSSVLVGQVIEFYFEIPSGKNVIFPVVKDEIFGFQILSLWDTIASEDQSVFVALKVTRFDTGYFEFKPLQFLVDSDSLFSESMTVYVGLPELIDAIDIYDIKPNITFYDNSWIAIVILILLLAVSLYFILKKYLKNRSKSVQKNPDPSIVLEDVTREKIVSYRELYLSERISPRDFYFFVDELLREYLEKKYSLNFLESTTSEVCKLIPKLPLSMYYCETLQNFFITAELIKFAKGEDDRNTTQIAVDKILEFLNSQKVNPFTEDQSLNPEKLHK